MSAEIPVASGPGPRGESRESGELDRESKAIRLARHRTGTVGDGFLTGGNCRRRIA